jgi:hypothetical protein
MKPDPKRGIARSLVNVYAAHFGTMPEGIRAVIDTRGRLPERVASDLAGVTALDYRGDRGDGNLRAAVGRACTELRERINRLGRRQLSS